MAHRSLPLLAVTLLASSVLGPGRSPARAATGAVQGSEPLAGAVIERTVLPSWREGAARQRLLSFIRTVTTDGGEGYVPPAGRIAVFDNDGTLWAEQPTYVQLAFAIDRARRLVIEQPELAANPVVAAAAAGSGEGALAMGMKGLMELVGITHSGMTPQTFEAQAREWFDTACHPSLQRPYTSLTYVPMLELLDLLRVNGFRTYIVSAGGGSFMRVISEELYGIPPEQVIGSSVRTSYVMRGGKPVILRQAELEVLNDQATKPLLIERLIGRPPIAAFGNSDGDRQMLEWTTSLPGNRLGVLVHHDDAEREWAYDRQSPIGKLDQALDEAPERGWTVVSMRNDWARVFPEPDGEAISRPCP
ncbi:MAG: haloacid dehalogenase-like hydrolase [Cyanobacteria bacterium]|nr:haloacid dehalogenase-like hydrolase [Cyanobacteria bacterium bin.51]